MSAQCHMLPDISPLGAFRVAVLPSATHSCRHKISNTPQTLISHSFPPSNPPTPAVAFRRPKRTNLSRQKPKNRLTLQPLAIIVLLQIRQERHRVRMDPPWHILDAAIPSRLRPLNKHL